MPVAAAPMDGTEPASREDPMSAATSTAPATQDMRRAGAALGALALAAVLVVAAAFTQVSSTRSQAAPAAGSAATAHDHGWSTASSSGAAGSRELIVRGSNGGGINYTGIPYASGHVDLAVPGEFVLGPGNLAPVGIAVALPPDLLPMRGEFRLGPGLAQPPGTAGTMQQSMTQELIVRGSNGGGINYTGIPYPAPGSAPELIVRGSNGGGITYTGIPYPAPASGRASGANGTRLAQ
jgi:hypothetical protein